MSADELDAAVKAIRRLGDLTVEAGLPGGDRDQIARNIEAIIAQRDDALRDVEDTRLALRGALAQRDAALAAGRKLLADVEALMDGSAGVYGLHLNGDPCPWSDLTDGGRYEEWLPLDHARRAFQPEEPGE
jgi:hypothetical protein